MLNAQAQTFHAEFVSLVNAGAGAYLSTEVTNAEQAASNTLGAPIQTPFYGGASVSSAGGKIPASGLLGGVLDGGTTSSSGDVLGTVSSVLGGDTTTTGALGSLAGASGLTGRVLGGTCGVTGTASWLWGGTGNVGGKLNSLLGRVGGLGSLGSLGGQVSTLDSGIGLPGAGIEGLFITGFGITVGGPGGALLTITPTDALGDLLPIFAIRGDIAQNMTNVVKTLTDTTTTLSVNLDTSNLPSSLLDSTLDLHVGLPLALGLDAIGAPVTTLNAMATSASAFNSALSADGHTGDGHRNGRSSLGGVLTPLAPIGATLGPACIAGVPVLPAFAITMGGTPIGGIVPTLGEFRTGAARGGDRRPDVACAPRSRTRPEFLEPSTRIAKGTARAVVSTTTSVRHPGGYNQELERHARCRPER